MGFFERMSEALFGMDKEGEPGEDVFFDHTGTSDNGEGLGTVKHYKYGKLVKTEIYEENDDGTVSIRIEES